MSRLQIIAGLYYLAAYVGPILIAAIILGIGEKISLRKQIKRKDTIKKISA